MKFTDRVAIGQTKTTAEGFLVATARVARTGVQHYLASELGDIATAAGFKPSDVVRVYRHADEVFHKDSLASITRLPVTVDHPTQDVTAENWAKLAVGEVGDAYTTEPDWIVVNPMVKDAAATKAARTTHQEVSMGYRAEIVPARDGLDADFEQRSIRYNHLALVPAGRAGPLARIGDSWGAAPITDFQPGTTPNTKGDPMTDQLKTVVLGDSAVQVAVTDVAAIERYKADMTRQLADAKAEKKKAEEDKDEEIGELKAKLKKAEDAAVVDIDGLVKARSDLLSTVHAIDSKIDPKGKTDAELRKAAVASKLGDAMVADASDPEIAGMFKAIAKDAKPSNPVADAFRAGVRQIGDAAQQSDAAHKKYVGGLNAWRDQQ